MELLSPSAEHTIDLGRRVGRLAQPGQFICLDGPLGTGKTQLVRGLAAGCGVADISLVCSPTYVFLNIYPADASVRQARTVYHLDAYRIQSAEDFQAIGFDELLDQEAVVVLEWAAKVPQLLPPDRLCITGQWAGENSRRWQLQATGGKSSALLNSLDS